MSQAIKHSELFSPELELSFSKRLIGLWPVIAPMAMAVAFILARLYVGPRGFLYEGALTMLALITYVSAAVVLVTNLFVRERVLARFGLISVVNQRVLQLFRVDDPMD